MTEEPFANDELSDEQWCDVLRLAEEAADLPARERKGFLESSGAAPQIIAEALTLASDFTLIAEMPAGVGARIGKFEITGRLGRGGMGEVYAARDTQLGRRVALKSLTSDSTGQRDAPQQFLREAQTASALNHPNIVTIYEVVRSGSSIAIVMELVDGQSLRQACQERLPVKKAIDIGRQIARALAAAHAAHIIHRDIKPENIILRPDGCIKVLDFGLARQPGLLGHSTGSVHGGTLRYMSPEQARGERVTSASDVFSFGLVLHELLSGRHAFPEETPIETAHAILIKEPIGELPGDIPADLHQLVRAMLSKEPAERPGAEAVASHLDKILASLGVPKTEATGTWSSKRSSLAVGVFALVAILIGIFWLSGRKRAASELTDVTMKPLTSQAGWELAPALSPDGKAIAFTWSARLDGQRQIYVKREKDAEPKQLTASTTGQIGYLVWSQDATRIAFKRRFSGTQGAICWIDTGSGEEHKMVDLANADLSSSIDLSPDDKLLAFSDSAPATTHPLALYLYNLQTGEKRKLTSPPPDLWGDWNPRFAPDGRTIAFKRVTGFWADDIYLVPTAGGEAKQFTASRRGIWGHAWMPDGKSLLISCQRSSTVFGIWRFPLDAPTRPERVAQGGGDTITPATSRSGRMAWVNQLWDLNIYRVSAKGDSQPARFIASTQRDNNPAYAPDGRIAWISDRSGSREIWMASEDGSAQTQVTHLNGPQVDHLQWSFDGRYLAFDSRPNGYSDIFLLECPPGTLKCGVPQAMGVVPAVDPGWSADSRTIYFSSNRSGAGSIWKRAVSGGPVVRVTKNEALWARESPDGKWLYFSGPENESVIWRIPGSKGAGEPTAVVSIIGRSNKAQSEGWALTETELVFIGRPDGARPAAIRAYNLATGKIRQVLNLTEVFLDRGDISLSVSKDGKSILYAQLDRSGSNVILAENKQ